MRASHLTSIALLLLAFTFRINATEPLCHTPSQKGICFYDINRNKSCEDGADVVNISGIVSKIHTASILPPNHPVQSYYQYYFEDTLSRFTHFYRGVQFRNAVSYNPDSLYAKVIQLSKFKKWASSQSLVDSSISQMMLAVDSSFILVTWDTQLAPNDSLVIMNYEATLNLMCSNFVGKGYFSGDYTVYPSSASAIDARPRTQRNDSKILVYTVDGKTQDKPQQFTPVVKVKN